MELWQNAISSGDMQTLEALHVLSETPKLGKRIQKLMYGLPGFALAHTKDLMLLDWQHASFPSEIYNNPHSYEEDQLLGAQGHHLHEIREEPFGSVVGHIRVAAANGHLAVVAFLNESREPCYRNFHQHGDSTAMDQAATNGHLKIVQYLHENHHQGSCTSAAMEGAVLSRHVEVVQFLHEHSYEGCSSQAMMDAVKNSQFEALQLLCDHRGENSSVEPSLQLATDLGRLKYVKFMYNELSSACLAIATSAAIVSSAAASGSLELIQFFHLHDQHFQFSRDTMHSAAVNGHLSIVKFLHEHRSEGCDVRTLFQCDERGHARVLEFLCLSRPIANPVAAIAKAKTQGRFVLVTMLERNSMSLAKKKYVYR